MISRSSVPPVQVGTSRSWNVAEELTSRLCGYFLRDAQGRRAVFGTYEKFQTDLHFRDHIPFYEYFHGDTGEAWAPRIRPAGPD